jgi:putative intracellular protease/amidase
MTKDTKHILMVLTSHDQLGDTGHKTGFWLEEFVAPYYVLLDAGVKVTLASPKGGQPPLDPVSDKPESQTDATRRFNQDKAAQQVLAHTLVLDCVDPDAFDGIFYPGGHGPLWDLVDDANSIHLIETNLAQHKPVAAVCHASSVLLNTKQQGEYLIQGKSMTGFSNAEEEAVQLTTVVPYLLEDELKARGAVYQSGENWQPFVVQDGLVITGQNPASSQLAAEKLLEALNINV